MDLKTGIKKSLLICVGLFFFGIGTAMMLEVGWGSSPAATLTDGLHKLLSIRFGLANILSNVFFLIIIVIFDRKLISVGTVLATLFIGFFIELGTSILSPLSIATWGIPVKAVVLVIGCVMAAVGLGYYVSIDFGIGAIDGMSLMLHRKTGIEFRICRWVMDGILVLAGVLMGAAWGVGTLLAVALTGPIMQAVMRLFKKKEATS